MDPKTEILIKGALSLLALAVVIWRHRPGRRLKPEQAGQLLTAVAVIAACAYPNFGLFHGRSAIHHWEQFHYFLGSKYFPEVRYDGLYVASLAAEREIGLDQPPQRHMRDLRTNEVVPTRLLRGHERAVRARFSDQRWRDFREDVGYFLTANSYVYITRIRSDHGYNPTPTWTFVARLFSRWLPASETSLTALTWLDALLLGSLFVVIFRTYGARIGCLCLIVFGLGYPWRFDWVGGAFLRLDWLAAVGGSVCLLKREKYALAGALVAYAAMVRVFPAAFLVGAAVLGFRHLLRRAPVAWLGKLAAGLAAGVAACLLAGCLTGIGATAWPQFLTNLEKHEGAWLTNNVGLKNLVLYDTATYKREDVDFRLPEPWIHWQEKMNRLEARRRPVILLAAAFLGAVVILSAWRQPLDQASVLGLVVIFAAVVLTCYYWAMLLLVPLGRGRWGPTAAWLGINTGLFALHLATPAFEMIYGLMSWALAVFFLAWMAPDARRSFREGWTWARRRAMGTEPG
ncbi:MAG: hypothetical protein ACC742_05555 [Thermoanaerobaculales bacterium]